MLREVFAQTDDPVATIVAVRERFGLSVDEAKKLWLEATGKPVSLTIGQEKLVTAPLRIVCPKCRTAESIERKVHALPPELAYNDSQTHGATSCRFVQGFWCRSCEVGFVPYHLLGALGLEVIRRH